MRWLFVVQRRWLSSAVSRRRVLENRVAVSSRSTVHKKRTCLCHPSASVPRQEQCRRHRASTLARRLVWSPTRQLAHRVYGRAERPLVTRRRALSTPARPRAPLDSTHAMSSAAGQPKVSRDSTPARSLSTRGPIAREDSPTRCYTGFCGRCRTRSQIPVVLTLVTSFNNSNTHTHTARPTSPRFSRPSPARRTSRSGRRKLGRSCTQGRSRRSWQGCPRRQARDPRNFGQCRPRRRPSPSRQIGLAGSRRRCTDEEDSTRGRF